MKNTDTTTTHTPGPWRRENNGIYSGNLYLGAVYAPTTNGVRPLDFESEANARLIAAAPDLLQVVRDYVLLCDLHGYVGAVPDAARAAIAKATGQA